MPLPQATIRYVNLAHTVTETTVEAPDSLALVCVVIRRCRALRAEGGSILWTEFVTDGITRRLYVDGRVGPPRITR